MDSFVRLDGQTHAAIDVKLRFDGSDWFLTFGAPGGEVLELCGETDGDRLRLDLRALDEVLSALRGAAITTYPGGQSVCAAHFDVGGVEGGGMRLRLETELDWDRALDPPDAPIEEPRVLTMVFVAR
ncbi:MAG: hypothetical protein H6721_14430 [Sandaracinus sp.]|nr:hypothetical protein [Myxococcales bacterium]MCB9602535.1 hypothetical protein [Sandaracinus sp.]MCB9633313.1 hypothetical protein [Sandaracinus sp.]